MLSKGAPNLAFWEHFLADKDATLLEMTSLDASIKVSGIPLSLSQNTPQFRRPSLPSSTKAVYRTVVSTTTMPLWASTRYSDKVHNLDLILGFRCHDSTQTPSGVELGVGSWEISQACPKHESHPLMRKLLSLIFLQRTVIPNRRKCWTKALCEDEAKQSEFESLLWWFLGKGHGKGDWGFHANAREKVLLFCHSARNASQFCQNCLQIA